MYKQMPKCPTGPNCQYTLMPLHSPIHLNGPHGPFWHSFAPLGPSFAPNKGVSILSRPHSYNSTILHQDGFFKSHQPSGRQVVSDLRVSIHPFNFTFYLPTSSNFPGGVVYPSSPLLPWLQNRPVARRRSRLFSTFS